MKPEYIQIVDTLREELQATYGANIDRLWPNNCDFDDMINIAISSYMSALFNTIASHAAVTEDSETIKVCENLIKHIASALPDSHLEKLVDTEH